MSGAAFGTTAGQTRRSAFRVCRTAAGHGSATTCGAAARSTPRNLGAASYRAAVRTGHATRAAGAAGATRHSTWAAGAGACHGTWAGTAAVLATRATRAGCAGTGSAVGAGRAHHGAAGSSGAHRLCGAAT
ncbi:hypothetical protein KZ829_41920 [Actinoplanes hulinensis]|uniref:Uncharacterized protein n=1 Tax=Actinoplanes hulinensis TaxID=1144547 RepID=A0ABS7BHE5_9ACTN|nr:hypothetical protein [Actinoplanes hulinensis]MBW6440301.1 hypothetical protein [Actinoplanes hulinensis]